jgi:hypothetical protein
MPSAKQQAERASAKAAHEAHWKGNVMAAVQARPQDASEGQVNLLVIVFPAFNRHLDAAALTRHVTRSSYVRRALSVAMAHDLHLPVGTFLRHTISPDARWDSERKRGIDGRFISRRDDGTGIHQWCPHPGCQGDHL